MITVFTAKHCAPCVAFDQKLKEQIKQGKIQEEVEIIDIETDEGFKKFKEEVLSKNDGGVPSAYKEGKQCRVGYDEDNTIVFDCPDEESLSGPPG